MNKTQTTLSGFPKNDFGYFHLTTKGWIRKDSEPFPDDRVETWSYDMEWPTGADKEQVRLARIWIADESEFHLKHLRKRFGGEPLPPTSDRHVVLDCRA